MRAARISALVTAAAAAVALAACGVLAPTAGDDPAAPAALTAPRAAAAEGGPAAVAGAPGPASLAASAAFFAASPVAVITGDDDDAESAALAERLAAPLLVVGGADGDGGLDSPGTDTDALGAELDRLGARILVTGLDLPDAVVGDRAVVDPASDDLPEPPALETPDGRLVALAADGATAAARATARAAGADVVELGAEPNPQASGAAIAALSADGVAGAVALGDAYADALDLAWQVASSRTGWQLPGGGQLLFPRHAMVALYGTPGAPTLGLLGEQGLEESVQRARDVAAPYVPLRPDRTVLPTFEIIATVASGSAGADGDYSTEIDPAALEPWVAEAERQGVYVVLDLQPGSTDFLTQARRYESLLARPNVGLALDPEWRLAPGQRHLVDIGQVGADEVNEVVDYLSALTRDRALPPKLLVLHQFRLDMIEERDRVEVADPAVTVLVHVDGSGGQAAKQSTWRTLRDGAPPVAWGWKNFVDEDSPMLTPEQTVEQVSPLPDLVSYQ